MQNLEDFKESLKNIISKTAVDFFLIHTDALRAPFRPRSRTPEEVMKEYVSDLESITNGTNYALPSFNYDFTKTGIYSLQDSESQVGAINEFIRKNNPSHRTLTPVFSHTYKNKIDFTQSLMPCDPFSATSFYGYLTTKNTILLHYGSEIVHTTLLHYIERMGKLLLYRYNKIFNGIVYDFDNRKFDTELIYHVRPKSVRLIYDGQKMRNDLISEGIMIEWVQKGQRISYCQIHNLVEFWLHKFNADPYYFLDPLTKSEIEPIIQKLGRGVLISDFE